MNATDALEMEHSKMGAIGILMLCGLAFAAGAFGHYMMTPGQPPSPSVAQQPIVLGDVRLVAAALNTLAEPQRYEFDPPVKIVIQGDGIVRVFLKTKREVKFEAKGRDLESAIADLSGQAREVASLKIWP